MRIGFSPNRWKKTEYKPLRVTVAVLVYAPNFTGYYKHCFDVIRICLESIQRHTNIPHELLVFDNGSCEEVSGYLINLNRSGQIGYLIRSERNIGKIGAWQTIFHTAMGEVIAYCDGDVFVTPGWLEEQLKILDTFPDAGMVSGWAIRDRFRDLNQDTDVLIKKFPDIKISFDQVPRDEWEMDFALHTGRNIGAYLTEMKHVKTPSATYKNITAYLCATHFQFIGFKNVLVQALPEKWSGDLMGQMVEYDQKIQKLGYYHLSTVNRHVRHMGNMVPDDLADFLGAEAAYAKNHFKKKNRFIFKLLKRICEVRLVRRILNYISDRIFWILHS
ncbi:MAG: hypothetical protein A3G33_10320 [Omnitrophica bacterium RIFCSPLOWO2_12_FULL_44_17]|uniref:Glycosyltransferase 2-like domain-containing protein n=1 Tax=Candidatus Danuiimicrobium aquiferis TaxID=1801832 RepID=A0A1G1L120_9BACT|nr:MAG: hypothetical protein A3B72_01595 [Omnitrophica bacterium RIFCSPHIGHO2_02_FULL_45_28]OGW90449.1 MAG: hypothetical protein A3E74_03530 [Omnitrophica bacterium RIFCSPHIGHO2_12_FULL_44_12]OGW98834.1 MAG: hypothetical protein A3G33_10320 [Omnitrophica bacterium RIFCSPLOWO2_12_FULL_44_17]OGX02795.1 MAG: hypothetical protein A3J12_02440 [Omnitrophica bacterium RIFCSPLOWO2_02_FULL_44_11]